MPSDATIEDLARAADDAGAALAEEVNELTDRLAPRQLVDEALETVKTRGLGLARDAGATVKAHPYVTAAAVAAVGLALYAGNRISKAELDIDRDIEGYTDYEDEALVAASSAGVDARELVKENPVVAILAGVAAGAALAMLFPTSTAEKRSLGALARRITSR
ncbi:hypothetical protein CHU93_15755 [Sandarakinorhabdus cyanobacteriorum]|uniref:DUF3618 domain-containing protein n=1 Tax=Sandarakinorhabdus cyanobacteriorum TaxID=1981098 RepID=A0A255Y6G8_9SPHN|nr:DUF3618 domain-containing protein [Sandarakinorhabdus cyanobacteriorum]OYQ24294.1 hypothetical protein CHU93_15755 [Sandarakinorhabdus cyanobacteriorum]